jgi:hypothetical protein
MQERDFNGWVASLEDASLEVLDTGDALARTPTPKSVETMRLWASKVMDGGRMTFTVPNAESAFNAYANGTGDADEMLLAGGEYRSIWNREKLSRTANLAGLEITGGRELAEWVHDGKLDVAARKCVRPAPTVPMKGIRAIMSMPRLAWTDTFAAVQMTCTRLGIDFMKSTGVFWGQCLERMMERVIEETPDVRYILTCDYDSVFDERDVIRLWQVMESNPDIDALFPLQVGRDRESCLLTMVDANGKRIHEIDSTVLHREALDCETGHFGLTLIRTDSLRKLPHPWFVGAPNAEGRWGDGRVDDDIHFWKLLGKHGGRICACPRVRIGHIQTISTWPGEHLEVIHQYVAKYNEDGRPPQCMTY